MRAPLVASAMVIAALMLSPAAFAQAPAGAQGQGRGGAQGQGRAGGQGTGRRGAPVAAPNGQNENIHLDGWNKKQQSLQASGQKPGPAPMHDLSGIWEPVPGYRDGVFASGPKEMPSDAAHEALMPYTAEGKKEMASHKSGFGVNIAPIADINDPFDECDPIGFPRIILFNLRGVQIVQTPTQVLMLYQNTRTFRTIWTDGREIPKDITEPRWFGYSVGKWTDPTTLVVTTGGLNDTTWIDNTGRPHSDQLVVEETYHRVDSLTIELTVKITDPVMYTQPWYPLKNFRLGMNAPDFDIREMICSVKQQQLFNSLVKTATDPGPDDKK